MCWAPHVDVEGFWLVDLEASRPGAVGCVHEPHTEQLIVVIPGPVEDHTGAWRRGDVVLWVGCALGNHSHYVRILFIHVIKDLPNNLPF